MSDLMRMITNDNHFGFARYGDEAMGVIASNDQHGLRRCLLKGLEHRQLGYWIGTPADPVHAKLFDRLVSRRYRQVMDQDALITSQFGRRLAEHLKANLNTTVMWVSKKDPPNELVLVVDEWLEVGEWDQWEQVRRMTFPRNTLVLIDAGLVGTCLATNWFSRSPRCTVIDMTGVWNAAPSSSAVAAPVLQTDSSN